MPTNSRLGRELVIAKVQSALDLDTKKEAEKIVNQVIACIEQVLLENLDSDQFSMKLNSFGKFTVKHKPGIYRLIPFTRETKLTKAKRKVRFTALGKLRQSEVEEEVSDTQNVE